MINATLTQVQHLMKIQNERKYLKENSSNQYFWISYKRRHVRLNVREEIIIRQLVQKLTTRQCCTVLKQLNSWIDANPDEDSLEIPRICIELLNYQYNMNIVQIITDRRAQKFQQLFSSAKQFAPKFVLTAAKKLQSKKLY